LRACRKEQELFPRMDARAAPAGEGPPRQNGHGGHVCREQDKLENLSHRESGEPARRCSARAASNTDWTSWKTYPTEEDKNRNLVPVGKFFAGRHIEPFFEPCLPGTAAGKVYQPLVENRFSSANTLVPSSNRKIPALFRHRYLHGRQVNVIYPSYQATELFGRCKRKVSSTDRHPGAFENSLLESSPVPFPCSLWRFA